MNKTTKPMVLIDGSSYLFRAFYALPPLTNSQGMPTGAIYGVLNMLKKLIKEYEPDYVAVVFDPKGKTFRNDLYPEYKANRIKAPDDLVVQIKPLHEAIKALGLPLVIEEGVEADDVIGTLALEAERHGLPTLISTGDKDMAQLVNDKVTLINTMSNTIMDRAGVIEKFGVPPERIIDYLALVGDTSDNIPGVPKVGPKTAVKWLNEYDSLDNIVQHAAEFTGKVGENLRNHLSELPLTRELVTIKTDVKLPVKPTDLIPALPNKARLLELFKEFEFKNWLQELATTAGEAVVVAAPKMEQQHVTILEEAQWEEWLQKLQQAKVFAFDTETNDLNSMCAALIGFSVAVEGGQAAYVPLDHDYMGVPKQLDKTKVLAQLQTVLNDKNKTMIGQNLKYDLKILRNCGITVNNIMRDTMLESYVLNSTGARHDMDSLALKYLAHNTIKFEDIAGKGAKQLTFNQIALEQAGPYATEDADVTLQLDQKMYPLISAEESYKSVFHNIEMPLMPVLMEMEYYGVLIDTNRLQQQSIEIEAKLQKLQRQIFELASEEFNIDSPKQLQVVLYEKLNLPVLQKTPTGQPSTAEPVLQELAPDYPMPALILQYRSLSKLKSTYADKLPQQVDAKTGRVHTNYNQAVTSTGRLSSNEPNLQNIPIRSEEGRKIRQAFIAPMGYKIVAADYSQIELRIMAHLSKDPGLLSAFAEGLDVHRSTAAEVFGVKLEDVTSAQHRGGVAY